MKITETRNRKGYSKYWCHLKLSCDCLLLWKDSSFTSAKGGPPAWIKAYKTYQTYVYLDDIVQTVTFIVVLLLWYPVTSRMWYTHHKAQENIYLSINCTFFYRPTPSFYPHQFLATSTFKLKFSEDCTLSKMQFYYKVTWHKSSSKDHFEHTLFLISSLLLKVKDNTLT